MARHDGDGDGWPEQLKAERLRVGLTQGELAARAGRSEDAIRKYEAGRRQPSQETLERILAALQVDWGTSYRIMTARGFHHREVRFVTEPEPAYYFTLPEVREFVERVPWPMFTGNELGEIAVANRAAQALWQVDLPAWLKGRTRASANLLAAMADPRIASRLANWEELLGHFVSVYKGVPAARAMLDDPGPLFEGILSALGDANPAFIGSLLRLWQTVPAREDKVRWMYPVVWREPGFPDIRFRGIVSQANERLSIGFNEWIPEDAASHAAYEAVLESRGANSRPNAPSSRPRRSAGR